MNRKMKKTRNNPVAKYCRKYNKATVQKTKKRKELEKKWKYDDEL